MTWYVWWRQRAGSDGRLVYTRTAKAHLVYAGTLYTLCGRNTGTGTHHQECSDSGDTVYYVQYQTEHEIAKCSLCVARAAKGVT